MILSRKHNKPFHPPLSMNQNLINNVNSHKHLGLTFSQDCSWHGHLELVKAKAWLRLNIMRILKFQLDGKSLKTIYISFIRPLPHVVWDNCTQQEANELEKIQKEAARIVTGATKLASIQSLLSDTGWESLTSRTEKHKLVLFYKMINSLAPEYLSSLVPPTVGKKVDITCVTRRTFRQCLQDPNSTTTHFSFQPRAFRTAFQTILRTLHRLNPLNINSTTTLPNHYLTTSLVHD